MIKCELDLSYSRVNLNSTYYWKTTLAKKYTYFALVMIFFTDSITKRCLIEKKKKKKNEEEEERK